MEVAKQLFGILLKHNHSQEAYWLQAGFTVQVWTVDTDMTLLEIM